MSLFTAFYKLIIWVARSVVLVLAVLFLSTLLRLTGNRKAPREWNDERDARGRRHGPSLLSRF